MRRFNRKLCLAALLVGAACGPGAGLSSSGDGNGDGEVGGEDPPPDVGVEGTTGEGDTCGNGVYDEGEWCYEPYVVDVELLGIDPMANGRLHRVTRGVGPEGETFVIWDTEKRSTVELAVGSTEQIVTLTTFDRRPASSNWKTSISSAQILPEGSGRLDYLSYTENDGSFRYYVDPGPSREIPSVPTRFDIELDDGFGGLLVPIDVGSVGADGLFAVDPDSRTVGLYHLGSLADDELAYFWTNLHFDLVQTWGSLELCQPVATSAGDVDGDDLEDGVILAVDCDGGSGGEVVVLSGRVGGSMSTSPQRISLGERYEALELADIDGDGISDIVLASDETLAVLTGTALEYHELSVPAPRSFSPPEYADETRVLIGSGQFDGTANDEIVFAGDGVVLVGDAVSGTVRELSTPLPEVELNWFAVSDLNHDGLDDVAVLRGSRVVIHASTP